MILNKASVNIHGVLCRPRFSAYLGKRPPGSVTAGSHGNSMFSFLRNCPLSAKWPRRPASPAAVDRSSCCPTSQRLSSVFWTLAILPGVQRYRIVVLICISTMTFEIWHLSLCFGEVSRSSVPFLFGCYVLLLVLFKSSVCILDTRPLSGVFFARILPHLWFAFTFS